MINLALDISIIMNEKKGPSLIDEIIGEQRKREC